MYKRIALEFTENVRDLGGYPVASHMGGITRYGMFIRSAMPSRLSPKDIDQIKAMNIKNIIDLRGDDELERSPSYFSSNPDFSYNHLQISGGQFMPEAEDRVARSYLNMTKNENMGHILRLMADLEGGFLYHCTAGKDRTGTVSALLLMTAGVADKDIIADYIVSYPYLQELINSLRNEHPDLPAYIGRSDPESMEGFLRLFKAEYGDIYSYLKLAGLTEEQVARLKAKLVDSL